eukprot:TRINITY_DN10832_c0_g1_i1.p1 TRINITY_DN10832_c0_g1~~TRINITY_DN10832_c0_g1_i1.p1  ORF type:complete len:336 (-),score=39.42 TRINITY_DN10832_c0_g1_i1:30-1037(-)
MYGLEVTSTSHVSILEPLLRCPNRLADEDTVTHFRKVAGNFCRLFYTNHDHYYLTHLFESDALDELRKMLSPLINFPDVEQLLSFFFGLVGTPRNIIEIDSFFFTSKLHLPLGSNQPLGRIEDADPPHPFVLGIPALYRVPSAKDYVDQFRQLLKSLKSIPFLEAELLAVARTCINEVKMEPTKERFQEFVLDLDDQNPQEATTGKLSVGYLLDQLYLAIPEGMPFDVAQLAKNNVSVISGSKADVGVGMYDDQSPHTLLFSIRLPDAAVSSILMQSLYRYIGSVVHVWDEESKSWRSVSDSTADPTEALFRSCFPEVKYTLFSIAVFLTALSTP